jgi:hypothetical protein
MASKLQVRFGRVLFQRLGTLKPVKQNYWVRAPAREGLWAFPWPYFSEFFTAHQYTAIKPGRFERLKTDASDEALRDEYHRWRTEVAPRVLPIRRFWFDGSLFTHVDRRGRDLGLDRWERVAATDFAERAARYLLRASLHDDRRTPRVPNIFDAETLEVFIPTRSAHFEPTPAPRATLGTTHAGRIFTMDSKKGPPQNRRAPHGKPDAPPPGADPREVDGRSQDDKDSNEQHAAHGGADTLKRGGPPAPREQVRHPQGKR